MLQTRKCGTSALNGRRCLHTRFASPRVFTQTVLLTDGSSFTRDTYVPRPTLSLTKDQLNNSVWTSIKSVKGETDESGRLAQFKAKFGSGYSEAVPQSSLADTSQIDDDFSELFTDSKAYSPNFKPSQLKVKDRKKKGKSR